MPGASDLSVTFSVSSDTEDGWVRGAGSPIPSAYILTASIKDVCSHVLPWRKIVGFF